MKNKNTKIKFTTKLKNANIKKKKKLKNLFFSLGFVVFSTSIVVGLVFLIEKAKKNKN
jgi:hypothetical protein